MKSFFFLNLQPGEKRSINTARSFEKISQITKSPKRIALSG
jgi:hypothetical protein